MEVPLYGGPVFSDTETDETLLRYSAFTSSSAFQVDRGSADRLMIGHPAAIMASYGKGRAFLFGPHLEHPEFPRANNAMAAMIGLGASPGPGWRAHGEADLKVRRSIADLKVAILGLENTSFVVGRKLWDGGRLLELGEAIERWSPSLTGGSVGAVTELLDAVADSLRSGGEGEATASESAPHGLVEAARICANLRFGSAQG